MRPARARLAAMGALVLAGTGLGPGCRRDCSAAPVAQPSAAAPAHRHGGAAADVSEQEALAFMPAGGTGPADRAVRRAQDAVRRTPRLAAAWIALGQRWVQKARNTTDPGYYLNADACAGRALALEPGAAGALALRAAVHLDAHGFEAARAAADEALRRAPDDLVALGLRADALVELGRYEEATIDVERLMALKPSLPAYTRASYLLWLRGRIRPALEAARRAIDAAPAGDPELRAWALAQAATIFWHRGDREGASAGFDQALAVLPGYAPALVGKGRVALAGGDAAGAVRLLEVAWRASPHAETAWLLGDARAAAGDEPGARAAYAEVERLGRAGEGRVLALFLAVKGLRPEEAVRLAEEERRVRPDVYSDDVLAWALYRAGRVEEARAASDRATRLGTPDARLLFHAGAIRIATGDGERGRALVRRALALNPGFDVTEAAEAARLVADGRGGVGAQLPRDRPPSPRPSPPASRGEREDFTPRRPAEESDFTSRRPAEGSDFTSRRPAEESDFTPRRPAEESDFTSRRPAE
jgi:tetratricopeptide (TPR) repeat protein